MTNKTQIELDRTLRAVSHAPCHSHSYLWLWLFLATWTACDKTSLSLRNSSGKGTSPAPLDDSQAPVAAPYRSKGSLFKTSGRPYLGNLLYVQTGGTIRYLFSDQDYGSDTKFSLINETTDQIILDNQATAEDPTGAVTQTTGFFRSQTGESRVVLNLSEPGQLGKLVYGRNLFRIVIKNDTNVELAKFEATLADYTYLTPKTLVSVDTAAKQATNTPPTSPGQERTSATWNAPGYIEGELIHLSTRIGR